MFLIKRLVVLPLIALACDADRDHVVTPDEVVPEVAPDVVVPEVVVAVCGDGVVEAPERCDDGVHNGSYGHCDATCSGAGASCGDGVIDAAFGELCDDGVNNGQWSYCSIACNGPGERCGNGFIERAYEACDDGDRNGQYGFCKVDCQGPAQACGDGVVTAPLESCDEGDDNGKPGHCPIDCAPTPGCGDGVVVAPEACDEGADNGKYGHCAADCAGMGASCGDGLVLYGAEACDDGVDNGQYGHCAADCQGRAAHCGDGQSNNGEICDDGANNGTVGFCERDCTGPTASWLVAKTGSVCQDDDLLAKYMEYRRRLRGDGTARYPGFVVRENIPGGGIPASRRDKDQRCSSFWAFASCPVEDPPDAFGTYNWGDGTSWVGDWLGLLGLEHAMFRMLGRSTAETEADILVALQTIDRLDSAADTYFGRAPGEPDGFFLRDDVYPEFMRDGDRWRFPRDPETTGFAGYACASADLVCEAPSVDEGSYTSQDQSISLVYGLAMVARLVDPNAVVDGTNLVQGSRQRIHLLVSALRNDGWKVTAPDGSHPPDKWGGNAIWFSDGLAKVADKILGEDFGVSGYRNFASRTLGAGAWDGFQLIWMTTHFYNRNMIMMLAGAGQTWGIDKLAKKAAEDNKDYYALVGALMSGRKIPSPYADWRVEGLLRSAPCGGPCVGHADCDARYGWMGESRIFNAHDRAGSVHVPNGEFNGIDYMSLFAAWTLYRGGYRVPEARTCDGVGTRLKDMNVGDVLDPRTNCGSVDLETLYCGRAVGSWIDDAARGRVTIFVRGSRLQCEAGGACVLVGSGPEHTDGDDLILGSEGADELEGGSGQDCLIGFGGDDVIEGNQGLDHIDGGPGHDDLYGEGKGLVLDGEPDMIFGGPGYDDIDGAPGNDELYGGDDGDVMLGGNGEDVMVGGGGGDEMHGGNEEDVMFGGAGDDMCIGDGSGDILIGGEGRDRLDGEAGDDYVIGGPGADFNKGGTGNDTFWTDSGPDDGADRVCGNGGDDEIWSNATDQCLGGGWLLGGKDEVHGCEDGSASESDCNAGAFNDW